MKELAARFAFVILSSVLSVSSFAGNSADSLIDCILKEDASSTAILGTASDYAQFAIFEGIRKQAGEKWPKEAWTRRFQEFNSEIKSALDPIRVKESALQSRRLRETYKDGFTLEDLTQICNTLENPYFAEYRAKAANSAAAINAGLAASTSGRAISDTEKQELLARAKAAEQEIQSFIVANGEKVSRLTSAPAFQRYLALMQNEARSALERISQAMIGDPDVKAVLSKWQSMAQQGSATGLK